MKRTEVDFPEGADLNTIERTIERCCATRGLTPTVRRGLVKYPGSVHWHFRKQGLPGTLEITLLKEKHRLFFSVHSNRTGAWIDDAIAELKTTIVGRLKSSINTR